MIILTTTSTKDEALKLAHSAVKAHLCACVNIIEGVTSIYEYEGKLCEEQEYQLVLKTTKEASEKLQSFIKKNHSYETPEILALAIEEGDLDYLSWIKQSVSQSI